jgi:hypothetical protein
MANPKKTSPATTSPPTPGPWHPLSGCYDNTAKDLRTGKFPRRYVTFVRDAKPCEPGRVVALVYGRTREETMANAHGMAAAFELLGACELMADWIDRLPASTKKRFIPELGDPEAVGLLWVYGVIDKAKGKAA